MSTTAIANDQVTVNVEQELYVIPCCEGYSCLGFDVCIKWANGIAKWLGVDGVDHLKRGSIEVYERYLSLCDYARARNAKTGDRCPALLVPQLTGLEGKRIEVVDCWGETRRFWVGKSTGWLPIHLEIEKRRDSGGSGVCGEPFKSVKMGHYQVDRIEADGTLVAGCHRIPKSEIERIAKLAGVA